MCICRTVEIKKRSFCGIINYFMFQKTWQKEAKVSTLEAKVSGGATILGTWDTKCEFSLIFLEEKIFKIIVHFDLIIIFRLIPQGTVDNNLGPDRLASPKAMIPYYCRQLTLWLHNFRIEVLIVHGSGLRLFWANVFSLRILIMSRNWFSSSKYNF